GIRARTVTGVQTCALPIFPRDARARSGVTSVPHSPRVLVAVSSPEHAGATTSAARALELVSGLLTWKRARNYSLFVGVVYLAARSEERRVGIECRSRSAAE